MSAPRGTELVAGVSGGPSSFSCPYHRWTFGTDGKLMSAPDFEQFHLSKADCALPAVSAEVCAGLIFVNFDDKPQPLRAWLGAMAEKLEAMPVARATTFTEYVYDIEANWKLVYDNFQENYHLRFIHPRSSGAGVGPGNPFGYASGFGFEGRHRSQTIWYNRDASPPPPTLAYAYGRAARAIADKGVIASDGAKEYLALFPNFFILGSPTQHFSHMVMPVSSSRLRGVIRLYWIGEDACASERFAMLAFAHVAMAVEVQGEDEPSHGRLRPHMRIVCATADAD